MPFNLEKLEGLSQEDGCTASTSKNAADKKARRNLR